MSKCLDCEHQIKFIDDAFASEHSPVAPQVRGEGTGALGSLFLPLSDLLKADQLCLDRWFALTSGQGQVLLRAQLGVSTRRWWVGLEGEKDTKRVGTEGSVLTTRELGELCPAYSFLTSRSWCPSTQEWKLIATAIATAPPL